jgi:hypothetical protein
LPFIDGHFMMKHDHETTEVSACFITISASFWIISGFLDAPAILPLPDAPPARTQKHRCQTAVSENRKDGTAGEWEVRAEHAWHFYMPRNSESRLQF